MHRATIFQIANHCNDHFVHRTDFLSNCENIQQRLRWMFTNSISSIDQWLTTVLTCFLHEQRNGKFYQIGTQSKQMLDVFDLPSQHHGLDDAKQ